MDIKIIGSGCDKCDKLYENTKKALAQLSVDAQLTKVEDLIEIVKLGVMTSPSMTIDGKLVVSGQVASTDQIIKILKSASGR